MLTEADTTNNVLVNAIDTCIMHTYTMQNQLIEYMGMLLSWKKKSTQQCNAELVGKVKHEDIQKSNKSN